MSFVSLSHGFAAAAGTSVNGIHGGIFETTDGGDHWKQITPNGMDFSGVYATKGSVFASEILDNSPIGSGINGEILYSRSDGATWDSVTSVNGITLDAQPAFQWIYGNRDSLVATVYYTSGPNTYLVYSTDLGTTWQSDLLTLNYQWGMTALHIIPHSCTIIRQVLDHSDLTEDTYSFAKSEVPFSIWRPTLRNLETGAWIAGNACALYLSYAGVFDGPGPLQRSTDVGASWQQNAGQGLSPIAFQEIDDEDWRNLSVVGHGATVYAGVLYPFPGVMKTTDGGDGSLSSGALSPQMLLTHLPFPGGTDTMRISECEPASIIITNENVGCDIAIFDSATVEGLDPNEFTVASTHYCGCTRVPDTSFITLTPKQAGIRNVSAHFHYTDDEFNQIDTALPVVLDVQSGTVAIPLTLALGSGVMIAHSGDTIEIPVYLSSNSSILLTGTTSIILPFSLDTNVLKVLSFDSSIPGGSIGPLVYAGGTATVPLLITGMTLNGKTPIGSLRCLIYLSDTLQTSVSLAGASINSAGPGCVALSTDAGALNITLTGCGDSTLLRFMQTGQIPFSITSANPNPARGILTARIVNPRGEAGRYRVLNAVGAVEMEGNISASEIEIDVAPLSNGIYLLRIESPSGFVSSRRFLIER